MHISLSFKTIFLGLILYLILFLCCRDSKSDDDDDDDDDNEECYNGGPESNEFNSLDSNQNASGKTTPSDNSLSGML